MYELFRFYTCTRCRAHERKDDDDDAARSRKTSFAPLVGLEGKCNIVSIAPQYPSCTGRQQLAVPATNARPRRTAPPAAARACRAGTRGRAHAAIIAARVVVVLLGGGGGAAARGPYELCSHAAELVVGAEEAGNVVVQAAARGAAVVADGGQVEREVVGGGCRCAVRRAGARGEGGGRARC